MEVWHPDSRGQRFLALEIFIQVLAERRFRTQGLYDEDAHPDQALLGGIALVVKGVE